eukprot:8747881-Prorocentrum_lima.AAC.1
MHPLLRVPSGHAAVEEAQAIRRHRDASLGGHDLQGGRCGGEGTWGIEKWRDALGGVVGR